MDIPILNPAVLNGLVSKFTAPERLLGRNKLFGGDRLQPNPDPSIVYDIIVGNRDRALPNVPNAEAHIIKQLGVGQVVASMIYMRDKKVFSPTTMKWMRTPGEIAVARAEQAILREIQDLDNRFEKFAEWCIWTALTTGTLVFAGGGVSINIDFQFRSSHKPTAGVLWSNVASDIIGDTQTWKRLITRDAGAVPNVAFLNSTGMTYFTRNTAIQNLLKASPAKTDELLNSARITGILGLTWVEYDLAYADVNGNILQYIPDNKVVLLSEDNPDRWYLYEGPSADFQAPEGHVGKFSKTWQEEDPSARQYLLEWMFLPCILRPDQIVAATIA